MFNPFEKLTYRIIEGFMRQGKSFLVSQTFERGIEPIIDGAKIGLLFTHYADLSQARIHLSALKGDKYAAIIDLEKEEHREKLRSMMGANSNYLLYSSLVKSKKEIERKMNRTYEEDIRRYIRKKSTWRVPADEVIYPQIDIAFGELFVLIKFRNQQLRFKLDELIKF